MDNLNYYSSWLPAWQQTDKYSSNPWCLKSKNLDIFSSSKSVKATAFSSPVSWDSSVIAAEWGLELRADGKVYEWDTLIIDSAANFPVYKVSYTWSQGTYNNAEWGTPSAMSVATEWNDWKSFVVYTDRAALNYSKVKYVFGNKEFWYASTITMDEDSPFQDSDGAWYVFKKTSSSWTTPAIWIKLNPWHFGSFPIRISAYEPNTTQTTISIQSIELVSVPKYYYDNETDSMVTYFSWATSRTVSFTWNLTDWWIFADIPAFPYDDDRQYYVMINLLFTRRQSWNDASWTWWKLYIDINWWPKADWKMFTDWTLTTKSEWDSNYYYSYLPLRPRTLEEVGTYYWMKGTTFQPLYEWQSSWVDVNWVKMTQYDFVQYMWWNNDPWMDIIWLISWNEQIYMVWNKNWNWYIIPCDLAGGMWTPFIAYWCTFKWVTNIDYLMYLVWEDRGISQLWVYNWQEMVAIYWWNEEKDTKNLIKTDEQYKFDWKIVEYRDNLILTTEDNRIFEYGKTYWGKGGAFIHQLPSNAVITGLKAKWNDLIVNYSITVSDVTTNYTTVYQDDKPIRNYNTEWVAEYPIVIWNHLLEKEESDLFVSYILPSANTSLEFWGMANHYHFRTFTSSDSYTFSTSASYKMKGATWNYVLKYIETNGNQYTFRLEWDLPVQTTNDMKITDTEWTELITYSEYNHFRKIWQITTDTYKEWDFRFTNLNNKLELPKSHSLQIMVKGKWTANYTPELFSVDLVANQRERW